MQICENTQFGPFWPLFLTWAGQHTQIQHQPSFCVQEDYVNIL